MLWQDIALTIISIVFSFALIPQVMLGFKTKHGAIAHGTSIPNFLGVYAISIIYITLKLYFSAIICVITGTLWLILFLQKVKYGKKLSTPPPFDTNKTD